LFAAACGGNSSGGQESFATYQACFDEHTQMEGLSPPCAIEICCIDHPIGSSKANVVCGTTAQSCEAYVTPVLMDGSDANLGSDIQQACTFYPVDGEHGGSGSGGHCSG
jgi:hypothetical protein